MTRFRAFSDEELNAMESAICDGRLYIDDAVELTLEFLVEEIRKERKYRKDRKILVRLANKLCPEMKERCNNDK